MKRVAEFVTFEEALAVLYKRLRVAGYAHRDIEWGLRQGFEEKLAVLPLEYEEEKVRTPSG